MVLVQFELLQYNFDHFLAVLERLDVIFVQVDSP